MDIVEMFTQRGFAVLMEYGVFVIMCIYVVFAFIMTRQLKLMNTSFNTPLANTLKTIGFLHFLAALFIAVITFFII